METSTYGHIIDWNETIKKETRGLNDAALGKVQQINENFVVTESENISKEKFYLPKTIPHMYNGRILLFDIKGEAKEKLMTELTRTMGVPYSIEKEEQEEESNKISTKDDIENSIPIIEERLEVSKKESIDEAKVIKEPIKETKTVEVQLTHEELIIERRPVKITSSSSSELTPPSSSTQKSIVRSKTETSIPLKREEVVVSKKPYVKEEIVIRKKPIIETKTITEEVTSEKVSVRNSDEVVKEEEKK